MQVEVRLVEPCASTGKEWCHLDPWRCLGAGLVLLLRIALQVSGFWVCNNSPGASSDCGLQHVSTHDVAACGTMRTACMDAGQKARTAQS